MNGKTMRLCFALMMLMPTTTATRAQAGKYTKLQRSVIEDRLGRAAGKDSAREAILKQMFEEAGCRGNHLEEQPVKHADAPNVICTLAGDSNDVIVVGAHFDHAEAGDGIADNWSGASLLPSLYQSLNSEPRRYSFVFIGFTEEENGFIGSDFYTKQLTEDQTAHIKAMINLDTLGLSPTEVWASDSDPALVEKLNTVASAMKLPLTGMNVDGVGDSDGRPFKKRKIPIITLHSVTLATLSILHTPADTLSAINLLDYYDSYNLIAGYLSVLDSMPENKQTPEPVKDQNKQPSDQK